MLKQISRSKICSERYNKIPNVETNFLKNFSEKMFRLIVLAFIAKLSFGIDNIIDNPSLLYTTGKNMSILDTKFTIKRTFNTIDDVIDQLNSINNLSTIVVSRSSVKASSVYVYLDTGTLEDLLNQTSVKLGYRWKYSDNEVLFTAISPITPKVSYPKAMWAITTNDKTIRSVFSKWCKDAGWQLVWNVNADYMVNVSWELNGTFESAINQVLEATKGMDPPLRATMHDSNKVLEVYSPQLSKNGML